MCERGREIWMEPIIGFPVCLELERCHLLLDSPKVKFYGHCDRIKTGDIVHWDKGLSCLTGDSLESVCVCERGRECV